MNVNGKPVQTEDGIRHILSSSPRLSGYYQILLSDKPYEHKCYPDGKHLGYIVPREWEVTYQVDEYENFTIIKNIVDRFRYMK